MGMTWQGFGQDGGGGGVAGARPEGGGGFLHGSIYMLKSHFCVAQVELGISGCGIRAGEGVIQQCFIIFYSQVPMKDNKTWQCAHILILQKGAIEKQKQNNEGMFFVYFTFLLLRKPSLHIYKNDAVNVLIQKFFFHIFFFIKGYLLFSCS